MSPKRFYICAALFVVLFSGCSPEEVPDQEGQAAEETAASAAPQKAGVQQVLGESVTISAERGLTALTAAARVTIDAAGDRILVRATGEDPQLTFGVAGAAGRATAVYVDIETPAAGAVELFYHIASVPFSDEHMISAPTKAGRNRLLLQINDSRFSGWFRLDPGPVAGDYAIRAITVFSDAPISLVTPERSQAELAAIFDGSTGSLFAARTPEDFAAFQRLKNVELNPSSEGLAIEAIGTDASLILPEFDATEPAIFKIVITSPAVTQLQLFHKRRGEADYTEAASRTTGLAEGENTVYLEHAEPDTIGVFRLDPGTAPGNYVVKEIEVRALTAQPR